jgi:glycine cleavage system aminomethyltransferase T
MWALSAKVAGIRRLISRTGYTGELGYEVLVPVEHAHDFWGALMEAGAKHGLALVGIVAAFRLRMERAISCVLTLPVDERPMSGVGLDGQAGQG